VVRLVVRVRVEVMVFFSVDVVEDVETDEVVDVAVCV
jgi:hypothetical protein